MADQLDPTQQAVPPVQQASQPQQPAIPPALMALIARILNGPPQNRTTTTLGIRD